MKGKIAVLKFGGSSVATVERIHAVADYILGRQGQGEQIAVVVSAMGDATDNILAMFLQTCPGAPQRERDQAMATGEQLAAALLAGTLAAKGALAKSLVAQQMKLTAEGEHGRGRIVEIAATEQMRQDLAAGTVLVCAGFQGIRDGDIVTLGRGGSDTTAVALAYALGAASCEIFTDVDGVYAVDPRIVPTAIRFPFISYGEMLDFSSAGAGVLMDRSVLLAQGLSVPIRVLLSPSIGPTTGGTLVHHRSESSRCIEYLDTARTCLAIRRHVAVATAALANQPGEATKVFGKIHDLVIGDAIQGQPGEIASISFWINAEDLPKLQSVLPDVLVRTECACLTLASPSMKESAGYFARLTSALGQAAVNIEMMSSAGNSILVIINDSAVKAAAQAVATEFGLCDSQDLAPTEGASLA